MSDGCKTFYASVIIQENGIIRHLDGRFLGRLEDYNKQDLIDVENHEQKIEKARMAELEIQGIIL